MDCDRSTTRVPGRRAGARSTRLRRGEHHGIGCSDSRSFPEFFPPGDGSVFDPFDNPYDLGLLWFPPTQNDGNLPANQDTTWAIQSDLDELDNNLNSNTAPWLLGMYGYGPTSETGTGIFLNGSFNQPPNLFTDKELTPDDQHETVIAFDASTPGGGSTPFFSGCKGDSGGPLFRQVSLNASGIGAPFDTIIIAVNSGLFPKGTLCADKTGELQYWARVDVATDWMVGWVRFWYQSPDFNPLLSPLPDGISSSSYIKLHGSACASDCDCKGATFCSNPITSPASPFLSSLPFSQGGQACAACLAPPIGDCGCVKGQCLPAPSGVTNSCH